MKSILNINLGILCFLLLFLLPHIIFPLFLELYHSRLWSERVTSMAVNHGQKAGPVASETITETFKCCLWLPAHITLSITGKDHLLTVGLIAFHMATYWHQRRWKNLSKFTRLVQFLPLNCGRVADISTASCTIPFSLNAKILQC